MKKLMVAGLVAASVLFTGCSNACEKAADTITDKYKECGIQTTTTGNGNGETSECTEAQGNASEKLADCIEKSTCDDIKAGTYLTKC
jgi:protein involved in sex pheromone biosynthesis